MTESASPVPPPVAPPPVAPPPVLAGQTAVVTGAGRGIGRGIAEQLAAAGASVTLLDLNRADVAEAAAACDRLAPAGAAAGFRVLDVTDAVAVGRAIDEVVQSAGRLDIAVSNAAYSDRQMMLQADREGFERTINVTMWGAFHTVRAAAEAMRQTGGGNLVVIGSPHAHMPMPGAMAYNMAKAAIDQMARTAAVELAGEGIRVNIIHPGWIDTPGERKFFTEETLRREAEKLPLGRLGRPQEIGRGVVFLCDPGSAYITGSTLTIDGGIQLPWREMYRVTEGEKAEPQRSPTPTRG